jgi:hypothetical protein
MELEYPKEVYEMTTVSHPKEPKRPFEMASAKGIKSARHYWRVTEVAEACLSLDPSKRMLRVHVGKKNGGVGSQMCGGSAHAPMKRKRSGTALL